MGYGLSRRHFHAPRTIMFSSSQQIPTQTGVVRKKLAPGSPGTRRLQARYGAALVCVRYREVETADGRSRRLTTVELVVDEREITPTEIWLRIDYNETRLRQAVKQAGGIWDSKRRLWRIPENVAKKLGLADRIVVPDA
jgi:hypothetical protein